MNGMIDLYVYLDESGVFDKVHNDTFVYGGIIYTDLQKKTLAERRYRAIENRLRKSGKYKDCPELKASVLENKDKRNLFSSLDGYRFAVVIRQRRLSDRVFSSMKNKEDFLNSAVRVALRDAVTGLLRIGELNHDDKVRFHIEADERPTATNGKDSLANAICQEFREGAISLGRHYPPILPNTVSVEVRHRKSESTTLVRAADIIVNRVYSSYREDTEYQEDISAMFISLTFQP